MPFPITRRKSLFILGAAAALPALQKTGIPATHTTALNVVLFLADDLHFRALGCQGNPEVHTPHIDRLAAGGMRFTRCHVSNPIGTPSRAAMLTGQYGFQNGVTFFGDRIEENAPRFPQSMADQGYQTAFTGKWQNNGRPLQHGFTHIRHTFLGGMHDYESIPVVNGLHDPPYNIQRNPTEVFTEGGLKLLDEIDRPFLLTVGFTAPHDPRSAPPEYEALYTPKNIRLPENFRRQPRFDPGTLNIRDEQWLRRPLDPAALRREIARYYAMITHMDDQIGLILSYLERNRLLDHTVILFTSDNGLALGSHGLLGKQTMYEEGIRVPLIVKGPVIAAGSEEDALVDLMDIAPTLVELAGGTVPESMQGRSLLPYLHRGEHPHERRAVFSHYDGRDGNDRPRPMFRMVKDQRYKLILHLHLGKEELFDLQADPFETNDLSASMDHQSIKTELRRQLQDWQHRVGDDA